MIRYLPPRTKPKKRISDARLRQVAKEEMRSSRSLSVAFWLVVGEIAFVVILIAYFMR